MKKVLKKGLMLLGAAFGVILFAEVAIEEVQAQVPGQQRKWAYHDWCESAGQTCIRLETVVIGGER